MTGWKGEDERNNFFHLLYTNTSFRKEDERNNVFLKIILRVFWGFFL